MNRTRQAYGTPLALALMIALGTACSKGSSGSGPATTAPQTSTIPDFSAATFSNPSDVDNPFFPIVPGNTRMYIGREGEDFETIVFEDLAETRVVMGVECAVVRDRAFQDGMVIEDTSDWYAQDDAGHVWYMGETVDRFEYDDSGNLIGVDHEGAWEAGKDVANTGKVARPGYQMRSSPKVGDKYHQEFYEGQAEDRAEVLELNVMVTGSDGATYFCLKTRESNVLDPGSDEHKYYAPGVGIVFEEKILSPGTVEFTGTFRPGPESVPDFRSAFFSEPSTIDNPFFLRAPGTTLLYFEDGDEPETIVIDFLNETRTILGVECAVVRDRVYADDLLVEDTRDWYAQDDLGNVWYMGEDVDNYEYDDDGQLLGVDHEGAWEAGSDVSKTGTLAQPGYLMKSAPEQGDSYHQEFYEGEAEDMARVARAGVEVELSDGSLFADCLQTLEWNPQEPGALEHKFYAPGVGVVREAPLAGPESVNLTGTFEPGLGSVPDFGAASFTNPEKIDSPYLRFAVGTKYTYEKETDEGLERIVVETLNETRVVMGIECAVVHDEVFLDDVLIEDTFDWFAQDDDGNVWYMGEVVDNYNYDDEGVLVDIDHEGSWEAGLDTNATGSIALPGYLVKAKPFAGDSFHQEFYGGEAEDMAFVVHVGVSVELKDGTIYDDCMQALEWNPLEPAGLEYKFYAPGIGVVLEQELGGETVELTSIAP